MTFGAAIRTCLRKYVTFSGRASRSEYWYFLVFVIGGQVILGIVDAALFGQDTMQAYRVIEEGGAPAGEGVYVDRNGGPLASLFGLATFVPLLSAGWRRMHDSGRTGLHLLYPLIVMVGIMGFAAFLGALGPLAAGEATGLFHGGAALILGIAAVIFLISPLLVIWWLTRPGDPGANAYGPPPSGERA